MSAATLNFVAFNAYLPAVGGPRVDGQVVTLFIIVLPAAQAGIAVVAVFELVRAFADAGRG